MSNALISVLKHCLSFRKDLEMTEEERAERLEPYRQMYQQFFEDKMRAFRFISEEEGIEISYTIVRRRKVAQDDG